MRSRSLRGNTYYTIFFISICILLIPGCATIREYEQQESFDKTADAYSVALRWGNFEVANGFRTQKADDQYTPDYAYLKNIRVTYYELKAVTVSSDSTMVQQTVEIKYYHIDELVEKELYDLQLWKYDSEEKKWRLHSKLPDFR